MYKKFRCKIPMRLQTFAEEGGSGGGAGGDQAKVEGGQTAPSFDYDKLASLIAGKQSVTEESVLKGYFRQQGLSKEQMDQAIASFKQQQAANRPDIAGMQDQLTEARKQATDAQAAMQKAMLENASTMVAISLGLDAKTIPYVLKMADLAQAVGQDGKINEETLKNTLNKVLEDVPALKPQPQQNTGFQLGAPGQVQQPNASATAAQSAVATKRWNRFNN